MSRILNYFPAYGYHTKPLQAKEIFIKSLIWVFWSEPLGNKLTDTVVSDRKVLQTNFAQDLIQTLSSACPLDGTIYFEDNSSNFVDMDNDIIIKLNDIIEDLYRSRKNPTNIHHHFPKCRWWYLDTKTDDRNKPIFNIMYSEWKVRIHSNTTEINRIIHSYMHNLFGESLLKEKLFFLLNIERTIIDEKIYKNTFEAINDIFSWSKWWWYKPEVLNPCNTLKRSLWLTDEDVHELASIQESFYYKICDIAPLTDNDVKNPYFGLNIKWLFNNVRVPDVIEWLIRSAKFEGKKEFLHNLLSLYEKYNEMEYDLNSGILVPSLMSKR